MRRPDSYTPSISPSADYPFGAYKDETSAGANDGSPIQRDQGMDSIHPWLLLLQDRGITVNNLPEVATNEQGLSALKQLIFESGSLQRTITSDETLLDTEIYNTFNLNPNTVSQYGLLTLIAPATGGNKSDKIYRVEHGGNQGLCRVDANGAQRFNFKGNDLQYILLYMPGNYIEFFWNTNTSKWSIKDYQIYMPVGYQNRSDWTAVHIGNGVTYDNKSAGVDFTGMVITEATSNFTGVVVEDTGGAGASGILYIYDLISSFTFWTNNRTITASDGTTADIDEATGTSRNINYNLYHGFGTINVDMTAYINNTPVIGNALCITKLAAYTSLGITYGNQVYIIDTNTIKLQTGEFGMVSIADATSHIIIIAAQDWYIYIEIII